MHQTRANLFTTKLANIAPGESITIEIQFQSLVSVDSTHFSVRMPLGITPRYEPTGTVEEQSDNPQRLKPSAQSLPSEVSQFNHGTQPDRPVSLTVNLNPGFDLSLLESPYHKTHIQQHDDNYQISLENPTQANRDFVLNWQPQLGQQPKVALFSEQHDNHNYHVLMMLPPTHTLVSENTQPREVIFVVDSSGSMLSLIHI